MKKLIINFHSVNDSDWFETIVLILKSKFELVDLNEFIKGNHHKTNKSLCNLSFDDGDRTFFSNVFPILKKHKVPATIFVSPQIILNHENFWFQEVIDYDDSIMKRILKSSYSIPEKVIKKVPFVDILKCLPIDNIKEIISIYQNETNTRPKPALNMNIDEIKELHESGLVEIGAHTMSHPILHNETNEKSETEITQSIKELSKLLNHEVLYFAYPNGIPGMDFGDREMATLKKHGIKLALSTEAKYISKNDSNLACPRLGFSHGNSKFVKIKLFLGGNWVKLKSLLHPTEKKNRKYILTNCEKIKSIYLDGL